MGETDTGAIDNSIPSSCNDRQADIGVTLFVTVTVLSESQREFQILFLIWSHDFRIKSLKSILRFELVILNVV